MLTFEEKTFLLSSDLIVGCPRQHYVNPLNTYEGKHCSLERDLEIQNVNIWSEQSSMSVFTYEIILFTTGCPWQHYVF